MRPDQPLAAELTALPEVPCFNGAIEACALVDDVDGGLSLLAEMWRFDIIPNEDSTNPLIAACKRTGRTDVQDRLELALAKLSSEPP